MLSPARPGHAEISVGNILGTVLLFVLFNAGLITLIHPLTVEPTVLTFYWPAITLALGWSASSCGGAGADALKAPSCFSCISHRSSSATGQNLRSASASRLPRWTSVSASCPAVRECRHRRCRYCKREGLIPRRCARVVGAYSKSPRPDRLLLVPSTLQRLRERNTRGGAVEARATPTPAQVKRWLAHPCPCR